MEERKESKVTTNNYKAALTTIKSNFSALDADHKLRAEFQKCPKTIRPLRTQTHQKTGNIWSCDIVKDLTVGVILRSIFLLRAHSKELKMEKEFWTCVNILCNKPIKYLMRLKMNFSGQREKSNTLGSSLAL